MKILILLTEYKPKGRKKFDKFILINENENENVCNIYDRLWIALKNAIDDSKKNVSKAQIFSSFLTNPFISIFEESKCEFDHVVNISIKKNVISLICTNSQGIVTYTKNHICGLTFDNCIERFIELGICTQLENMKTFMNDIHLRNEERSQSLEYHQTSCYENDFLQISKIKDIALKIAENCNKKLEYISEKYTKY